MRVRVISAYWAQKLFNSHFLDMMYVELIKNFFLPDSRELMGVKVISTSWARKRLIPLSRHDVPRVHEKFFLPIPANWWVLESFQPTEPKNDWFPLSRYDVPRLHEKFFFADSRELMGVRVISTYWAQKRLIPTF